MDIRAFGTVYGQVADLSYASGFLWSPLAGQRTFPTCRAIRVQATANTEQVYLELNDAQGQMIPYSGFASDPMLTGGFTTISGGDVQLVNVLF